MNNYSGDCNGYMPAPLAPPATDATKFGWTYPLIDGYYVKAAVRSPGVFACPVDNVVRSTSITSQATVCSYGANSGYGDTLRQYGWINIYSGHTLNLNRPKSPSRFVSLTERHYVNTTLFYNRNSDVDWWKQVSMHRTDGKSSNVLYFDGHVSFLIRMLTESDSNGFCIWSYTGKSEDLPSW